MGSSKRRNLRCEARSSCKLHIYVVPDQRHHGQDLAGLTFESAAVSTACTLVLCIERTAQINTEVAWLAPARSGQRVHVLVTIIPASGFEAFAVQLSYHFVVGFIVAHMSDHIFGLRVYDGQTQNISVVVGFLLRDRSIGRVDAISL